MISRLLAEGPRGSLPRCTAHRKGLRTVMIEREAPGGQAGLSSRIENYLGFPSGLSGSDLARRAVAQARRFDVEILSPQEAVSVRVDGPYRYVKLGDGVRDFVSRVAAGDGRAVANAERSRHRKLQGAGVYYGGGTSEAISCKGETVYIIGGANSAGQAAMHFSKFAQARWSCWCVANRWRRRCRTI